MVRNLLTMTILAGLSAWVAAQGPAPGETAGERMTRFSRNRILVETLVDRSLELTRVDVPLHRARVCHETTIDLQGRLKEAVAANDAVRVAELAEYLDAIVREALVPTLTSARQSIPVGSPDEAELLALRDAASTGLEQTGAAVPREGRLHSSARIRLVCERLDQARVSIATIK